MEKIFKNKKTSKIIKIIETDNPNWKWKCSDKDSMRIFIESFVGKDIDKELKKNWEEQLINN